MQARARHPHGQPDERRCVPQVAVAAHGLSRRDQAAAVFDRWALTYDSCALRPLYHAAHDAVLRLISDLDTGRLSLLDVGCGTGQLLHTATTRMPFAAATGVDLSGEMLTAARRVDHSPVFVRAAAEQLPFADGAFDLVTSTLSLHHWTDPQSGLREIARVLAPAGRFYLAEVLTTHRKSTLARLARRHTTLPAALELTMTVAGLKPVQVRGAEGFGPACTITVVIAHKSGAPAPTTRWPTRQRSRNRGS